MTQMPTYEIPMATWPSVETLDSRGRHAAFSMYTWQGNEAVAAAVRTTVEAAAYCSLTRDETLHLFRDLHAAVQRVHPEITDTEPRGEIREVLSKAFMDELGFVAPGPDEVL
jgi:hypothetical protein